MKGVTHAAAPPGFSYRCFKLIIIRLTKIKINIYTRYKRNDFGDLFLQTEMR